MGDAEMMAFVTKKIEETSHLRKRYEQLQENLFKLTRLTARFCDSIQQDARDMMDVVDESEDWEVDEIRGTVEEMGDRMMDSADRVRAVMREMGFGAGIGGSAGYGLLQVDSLENVLNRYQ